MAEENLCLSVDKRLHRDSIHMTLMFTVRANTALKYSFYFCGLIMVMFLVFFETSTPNSLKSVVYAFRIYARARACVSDSDWRQFLEHKWRSYEWFFSGSH
jgi:hypothetical protein